MPSSLLRCAVLSFTALAAGATFADPFVFSTGDPSNLMATASRPSSAGRIEIESADDFVLPTATLLTGGTFTGLLSGSASVGDVTDVVVEIYRVFPSDSDVGRTSGPPTFSTANVPTRVNSPADVALASRSHGDGNLGVTITTLAPSFTASNSVLNGINPKPGQTTGGEGAVTGTELRFGFTFSMPLALGAGHYFLVPQVALSTLDGEFYWLSAPKPIVPPGTPFLPDLQSWIRNENLAPDWLRVGTDIVGSGSFNAAFSLAGETAPVNVPEPATPMLLALSLACTLAFRRQRRAT